MFTGLVQEIGTITRVQRMAGMLRWTIRAPESVGQLHTGDSINVAGACQTVETLDRDSFTGAAIPETLARTTFLEWRSGTQVNLELALRASDRLGGHIVTGHVDTVGSVVHIRSDARGTRLSVAFDRRFANLALAQGSIALDGVSLTIAEKTPGMVTVALIPETLKRTTLGGLAAGDMINIEFDQVVKAIVQQSNGQPGQKSHIDSNLLAKAGWN
ncbi:MAG: riboflavin synthase [candidate division Zixibacteria bacterium]|nr:riboflavin synthase [candidate division Zixibacteria bacterium]